MTRVVISPDLPLREVRGPHGSVLRLDAAGHVCDLQVGDLRVNLFRPGLHDRPADGIWLRRRRGRSADAVHLMGRADRFAVDSAAATWSGSALGVRWRARLSPTSAQAGWQWDIDLEPPTPGSPSPGEFDLVLVQDVALAPASAARTNELYISHYVTHELLVGPASGLDVVVASRQTMTAAPRLPLLLCQWVGGSRAASTDAFDLEGVSSRRTDQPAWMGQWDWPTRVRQYEHAQVGLVSAPWTLVESRRMTCLLTVVPDHRAPMAEALALLGRPNPPTTIAQAETSRPLSLLAEAALQHGQTDISPGPDPLFLEQDDAGALSWFDGEGTHLVAGRKEELVERSHGHILVNSARLDPADPALCATVFAPGVFCSHVALGNTNFHRIIDVHRDGLNRIRSSGVRLLVDTGHGPRLLGIPTLLAFSWGSATWTYRWDGRQIRVRTVMASGDPVVRIHLDSSEPVRVLATMSLDRETGPWVVESSGRSLTVTPGEGHVATDVEPGLAYVLTCDAEWEDDRRLWSDIRSRSDQLFLARSELVDHFDLAISASTHGSGEAARRFHGLSDFTTWEIAQRSAQAKFAREVVGGFQLSAEDERLAEITVMVPWLAHDMVVHLLSPHGLEQFSGAAWGTRDVCQGPMEMALACGHLDLARDLLRRVFAHQFRDGGFAQWFMFDGYSAHQPDSHGDVPVWPLLALAEFLAGGGDARFLDEAVGWFDRDGEQDSSPGAAPIADHVSRIVDHVEAHVVAGTDLYAFGEGDWDDTLQPADAAAREGMVSSWTVGLLVEATETLGGQLAPTHPELAERLDSLAARSRRAFESHLVVDGMVAGLVRFGPSGTDYLIHPRDDLTGQRYRLISITQALLAGLLTPPDRAAAVDAVGTHLSFVDGVRLMDRPMPWHEGVPRVFRRAEQSAFFGREVGLMYTHAHLRWVQALARMGDPSALDALLLAVPVQLDERLGGLALPRQRNCYYSSSDARFMTRRAASEGWDDLREARIPVSGGWRVYSSGPGIMIRLLIREILGVRREGDQVVLEPDLPILTGPVNFALRIGDGQVRFHYLMDLPPGSRPRIDELASQPAGRGVGLSLADLSRRGDVTVHLPMGT